MSKNYNRYNVIMYVFIIKNYTILKNLLLSYIKNKNHQKEDSKKLQLIELSIMSMSFS